MSTVQQANAPAPDSAPAPGSTPAKATTPVPQPSGRRVMLIRLLLVLILVLGAFGVGILLSTKVLRSGHDHQTREEPEGGAARENLEKITPEGVTNFARIDTLIRDGHHEQALAMCQASAKRTTGASLDALEYRAAFCLEVRGEQDKAFATYRAIINRSPDSHAAAAAGLGQARCWLRQGKALEARSLLNVMVLRSALPAYAEHTLLADAAYLLASTLVMDAAQDEEPGPFHPLALARARPEIQPEPLLDWVTPEGGMVEPHINMGEEGLIDTRRLGNRPEEVSVTVAAYQERLASFIERLAAKCGIKVAWSTDARMEAETHVVTVVVEQMPLSDLVRGLALEANLGWETSNGSVTFSRTTGERAGQRVNADKVLRASLLNHPDHPLAAMAMLELGNLEVTAGHYKEALSWYERMVEQSKRVRVPAEAYYNMAIARTMLGDRAQARDAFYWVTDRAPSSDLAGLAFLQIGHQYLEENDPVAAMRPLRRALATAPGSETRTAAGLLLAAANLLTDNPRAAYSVLAEVGPSLRDEPFCRPAALVDALARYRMKGDPSAADRDLGDLMLALKRYREEPILGAVGVMLAGRGHRELGSIPEMIALYEGSTHLGASTIGQEIAIDLGNYYFENNKRPEARKQFEPVAAAGGKKAAVAEQRLAWLDLLDRRADDCIQRCRKLLPTTPGDKKELLTLMGKAYTLKGDFPRASECFAGKVPQ